jgi:hypothetical protein
MRLVARRGAFDEARAPVHGDQVPARCEAVGRKCGYGSSLFGVWTTAAHASVQASRTTTTTVSGRPACNAARSKDARHCPIVACSSRTGTTTPSGHGPSACRMTFVAPWLWSGITAVEGVRDHQYCGPPLGSVGRVSGRPERRVVAATTGQPGWLGLEARAGSTRPAGRPPARDVRPTERYSARLGGRSSPAGAAVTEGTPQPHRPQNRAWSAIESGPNAGTTQTNRKRLATGPLGHGSRVAGRRPAVASATRTALEP